ncbi:PFS2 [Ecytonucleospora hepatopenaei]|uniref:Polyadenylation factor subunit 2 n=1 Tax=Ecytonucleospora hepatopenaei TaxID=646526 RepID=A0A1W0E7Q2_9MICR|nr:PFS2 [Ecytonucleospora hepatopenaei]
MQNKQQVGGKFVYDGKRIQPIYERTAIDFNSLYFYSKHNSHYYCYETQNNLDMESQVINNSNDYVNNKMGNKLYPTMYKQMCINKLRSPVSSVCWCPDGRRIMTALGSGEITLWNGVTFNFDTIIKAHDSAIKALQWSRRKDLFLSSDSLGFVKYWNGALNTLNEIEVHKAPIKDLSFSFDDSKFCTASDDSQIKVVDVFKSEVERSLKGHNWDVRKAKFHKYYSLIASGGKDNLIKLWDPRIEECIGTFHYHKNTILAMEWFKDEYLVSGGKDQVIQMFDLRKLKETFSYKSNGDITALETYENRIVLGNGNGEIHYYEEFNPNSVATSDKPHENTVWTLAMHPAGHILVSGAADYQTRFWTRLKQKRGEDFTEKVNTEDKTVIPGLNF